MPDTRETIEGLNEVGRFLLNTFGYKRAREYLKPIDDAIFILRESEAKQYNTHEVACIIADLFGDPCACNFNNIDEWLPYKCEFRETCCPNPAGVACWEQYLIHKEENK